MAGWTGGRVYGCTGGIGNKDQLSPAKAGAGAERELGIIQVGQASTQNRQLVPTTIP